jgi:hypothetical protein
MRSIDMRRSLFAALLAGLTAACAADDAGPSIWFRTTASRPTQSCPTGFSQLYQAVSWTAPRPARPTRTTRARTGFPSVNVP